MIRKHKLMQVNKAKYKNKINVKRRKTEETGTKVMIRNRISLKLGVSQRFLITKHGPCFLKPNSSPLLIHLSYSKLFMSLSMLSRFLSVKLMQKSSNKMSSKSIKKSSNLSTIAWSRLNKKKKRKKEKQQKLKYVNSFLSRSA